MAKVIETPGEAAETAKVVPTGPGSLENLAMQAEQLQLEEPADGQPALLEETPKATNAQLITGALIVIRDVVCDFAGIKSPKKNLDDDKAESLGNAWGAVADKHGIDLAVVAGDYAAELAAIICTVPVAIAINAGVRAELAELDKDKPAGALPAPKEPDQVSARPLASVPGTGSQALIKPSFPQ